MGRFSSRCLISLMMAFTLGDLGEGGARALNCERELSYTHQTPEGVHHRILTLMDFE